MTDYRRAFSGFAVDDTAAAKDFYGDTLGIEVRQLPDGGLLRLMLPGGSEVLVYPKADHRPAGFTILNFVVDDIDRAVEELTGKGVQMLRYDGFGQDERGISRNPSGPPIAWFSDPAGNILAILED